MQQAERTRYVGAAEGLQMVQEAGLRVSRNTFYEQLPTMPGVIRIGKKFFVPIDIVSRLANSGS